MDSWERGARTASQVLGLALTVWVLWLMLPPQTRATVRARSCRRLSAELGSLAVTSGRVGIWLEAGGWDGHHVLYETAARCRLAADDVWGRAFDGAW